MRPTARGGERLSACIVHTVSRILNLYFTIASYTALPMNDQPKARCYAIYSCWGRTALLCVAASYNLQQNKPLTLAMQNPSSGLMMYCAR